MALTPEEKDKALFLYKRGKSWNEIYAEFPHKKPDEVRSYIRTTKAYKKRHSHKNVAIDDIGNIDPDEFLDELINFQNSIARFDTLFNKVTYFFNKPFIIIVDWGDWHLGAVNVDYEQFKKDVETIKKTPNLYAVMNGDMIDNSIEHTHPGTRFEQIITPKIAKELVKRVSEELAGKWLAIVSGDHDTWSFISDDFKPAEYFAKHAKTPFFDWGGEIEVVVGEFKYVIQVRHKYVGASRKNLTNVHENLWREKSCDIAMLAHTHRAGIHQEGYEGGRLKIFLNSGTYKRMDNYAKRGGYEPAVPIFPAVILSGVERKAIPFLDFREAIRYVDNLYM